VKLSVAYSLLSAGVIRFAPWGTGKLSVSYEDVRERPAGWSLTKVTDEAPGRLITSPKPRARGLADVARALAEAVDQSCRMLRLPPSAPSSPTLPTAAREQMTYRGFLAPLVMSVRDDGARHHSGHRIKATGFPATRHCALSTSTPTRASTPPSSTATGSRTGFPSASSATRRIASAIRTAAGRD
jgi:hypothetical protein